MGRKHDVVACVVEDPAERKFPEVGLVDLYDPETELTLTVDTSSKEFQKIYAQELENQDKVREDLLRKAQVDRVNVVNDENYVDPLIQFFRRRHPR